MAPLSARPRHAKGRQPVEESDLRGGDSDSGRRRWRSMMELGVERAARCGGGGVAVLLVGRLSLAVVAVP
jgi:hypothetical protein